MALGMLVEGKWTVDWTEHDEQGNFKRMLTQFRNKVEEVSSKDKGRYILYVSYACPWAHRTIMTREYLQLTDFIDLVVVEPHVSEKGWYFSENFPDHKYGLSFLQELYLKNDSQYTGRVTVPVLWDSKEEKIVNNESLEIIKMFDGVFREAISPEISAIFKKDELKQIEDYIAYYYENINNACYRTGFAKSQEVYNKEVTALFGELEKLNSDLASKKFLLGDHLSAADICLLPTLLRFDVAYHGIFKCNIKRLKDFEFIQAYMKRLLDFKEIEKTYKPEQIKNLYYKIVELNPSEIVPLGQA